MVATFETSTGNKTHTTFSSEAENRTPTWIGSGEGYYFPRVAADYAINTNVGDSVGAGVTALSRS